MLLVTLIIIACIIVIIVAIVLLTSIQIGIVPMPSLNSERLLVSDILKAYPDILTVTDLGSGWGGMTNHLARKMPERKIIAVEKSIIPHLFFRVATFLFKRNSISHFNTDIYERVLKNNEAYITYLSGTAMKKLRRSFERDHPTGGVLLSIAFAMPGWTPARIEYTDGLLHSPVYIYEI